MSQSQKVEWTENKVNELKLLVKAGYSAQEIADHFNCTRNQVEYAISKYVPNINKHTQFINCVYHSLCAFCELHSIQKGDLFKALNDMYIEEELNALNNEGDE